MKHLFPTLLALLLAACAVHAGGSSGSNCMDELSALQQRADVAEAQFNRCEYVELTELDNQNLAARVAAQRSRQALAVCALELDDCNVAWGHPSSVKREAMDEEKFELPKRAKESDLNGRDERDADEALCYQATLAAQQQLERYHKNYLLCMEQVAAANKQIEFYQEAKLRYDAELSSCQTVKEACNLGMRKINITVKNEALREGTWFTPVYIRFSETRHAFFGAGSPACTGIENVVRDADFDALYAGACDPLPTKRGNPGDVTGVTGDFYHLIMSGPYNGFPNYPGLFAPLGFPLAGPYQTSQSEVHIITPAHTPYLSFIAGLLPSDDAFLGLAQPNRLFIDKTFVNGKLKTTLNYRSVWDAGVYSNDEKYARFFNDTLPGRTEQVGEGFVQAHPGYLGSMHGPSGTDPVILGGRNEFGVKFNLANADFTKGSAIIMSLTFEFLPWRVGDLDSSEYRRA